MQRKLTAPVSLPRPIAGTRNNVAGGAIDQTGRPIPDTSRSVMIMITPITVLINVIRRGKVANLPAPQRPPHGPSGRPMEPGAPLLARPSALIGLGIPVLLVMLLVFVIALRATSTP